MKKKEKIIGSIAILVFFIIFLSIGYYISRPKKISEKDVFTDTIPKQLSSDNEGKSDKKEQNTIMAEIRGEVKTPGIYTLKNGSRVKDLLEAAGGFTGEADKDSLIQVTPLKDNTYIRVCKKGEKNTNMNYNQAIDNQSGKININSATKEQLMSVSGIGEVTAQNIINYREKNGPFNSLDDLKKVGRIGDKTIAKFKDKLDVK